MMSEVLPTKRRLVGAAEPYWILILLFVLGSSLLYLYHLATGYTPDRAAFTLPFLGLAVYWYGILITGGILLGSYVVSRLVYQRAERLLLEEVPAPVRKQPVSSLELPDEIGRILDRRGVNTLGQLLLKAGWGGDDLGLNQDGLEKVREQLKAQPIVEEAWLVKPSWAAWNPAYVWNGLVWCLVLAVIGARLYHVLTPSPSMAAVGIESPLDYFRNPLYLVNLRRGGLGIYGGIAGGALGLLIFTYRYRLPVLAWADLAVIGLALGQFVGRWGNFINQELYGRPTDLPWGITIDPVHRLVEYADVARFHPAFLYESLWNLMVFIVLMTLLRRRAARLLNGDLMALYLILYAIGRILLETVRLDSATVALGGVDTGLPTATLVSAVLALVMGLWLAWRHGRLARA